jgi:zinc transport system substrate-binding protein
MKRIAAALSVLGLLFVAACGGDDDTGASRPQVVASFFPIAEAAQAVGGDLVDVANLTPAGTEPHDLELTTRQVDRLQDAALVLYLGQGFQPAIEEIAEERDGPSVDLLAGLPLVAEAGEQDDDEDGALDPHFWLDPTLMSGAVDEIEQALAEVTPEHAAAFAANADEYRARLADLDAEFQSALADCARKAIVTSHAAFSYLAQRYGLEQLPIAGLSPESEPTPQRLDELADLIATDGVTTVFYEALVDPDVAETLAREAGVETAVLNPIEGLSDEDVEAGKDYVTVMRENLAALTAALGCE